jgi:hypothetical protein
MDRHTSPDVSFAISLDGERVGVRDVTKTLVDVERLLADIERRVRGVESAQVTWAWAEDNPPLELVASVNGATREELARIVEEARRGFETAKRAAEDAGSKPTWPDSFGPEAQRAARSILRRLEHLESITVQADQAPPVVITAAETVELATAGKRRRRLVHSAVDGRLDLISKRGRLRATIKDHSTGAEVQCSFPDEMIDTVTSLFTKRVVAEGLVHYRADGRPISITNVTSIRERRAGRPLEDLIGATPDLAGGIAPEEFIALLRGDD